MGMKRRSMEPQRATSIDLNGDVVGRVEQDDAGRIWAVPDISGIARVRSQYWTDEQRAVVEHMEVIDVRSRFPSRRAAIMYLEKLARRPLDLP